MPLLVHSYMKTAGYRIRTYFDVEIGHHKLPPYPSWLGCGLFQHLPGSTVQPTPSIRAVWAAAHDFGINNQLPLISTSCPDPFPKPQVSISSCLLGKSSWKPYRYPTLSVPGATQQTSFWQLSKANNTSATGKQFVLNAYIFRY